MPVRPLTRVTFENPVPMTISLTEEGVEFFREQLGIEDPTWLSVKQAASKLGVSKDVVYEHAEELGGRKVGGIWRFPPDLRSLPEPDEAKPSRRRRRQAPLSSGERKLQIRGKRPE